MEFIKALIEFIYPPRCIICDKPIQNEGFCENCKDKLHVNDLNTCFNCGIDVKHCECNSFFYHFDGIVSPYFKEGYAKDAVYNLKFRGRFNCVETFGLQMADFATKKFGLENIDAVTFVPANKKSLNKRGFNQSELLARVVSKHINKPLVKNLLYKDKSAQVQHKIKNVSDRFENARNSYRAKRKCEFSNFLLVDDIKTTGASLDECARQLKFAGAEKVYCVTALISRKTDSVKRINLK